MSALDEAADDGGACFEEVAICGGEGCGVVAVDVDFADGFAVGVDGHYDLGFGFDGAGEIARVGMDVVDDDGLILRYGGSADALVDRDACVFRGRAVEGGEDEHFRVVGVEHVEAGPVVMRQARRNDVDDEVLQGFKRWGGGGEGGDLFEDTVVKAHAIIVRFSSR